MQEVKSRREISVNEHSSRRFQHCIQVHHFCFNSRLYILTCIPHLLHIPTDQLPTSYHTNPTPKMSSPDFNQAQIAHLFQLEVSAAQARLSAITTESEARRQTILEESTAKVGL